MAKRKKPKEKSTQEEELDAIRKHAAEHPEAYFMLDRVVMGSATKLEGGNIVHLLKDPHNWFIRGVRSEDGSTRAIALSDESMEFIVAAYLSVRDKHKPLPDHKMHNVKFDEASQSIKFYEEVDEV